MSQQQHAQHPAAKMQRIRVRFARSIDANDVGHLDITRCWADAFAAGGIHVSQTQGNRPTPRITLAAGLPAGVTSEGELLDAVLADLTDTSCLSQRVRPHLPAGIEALAAWEVGLGLPSLPTLVRWADYEVDVRPAHADELRERLDEFLAQASLLWVDTRGEKRREYDLRALVQDVRIESICEDAARLSMRLRNDSEGVGRPDQLAKALGLQPPSRIHRLRLVISETSPARDAWRRRGRYAV
jgi:radical SAM-linked protein